MKAKASQKKSAQKDKAAKKKLTAKAKAKPTGKSKPMSAKSAAKPSTKSAPAKSASAAKKPIVAAPKAPMQKASGSANKQSKAEVSAAIADQPNPTANAVKPTKNTPAPSVGESNQASSEKLSPADAIRKALEEKGKKEMWPGTGESWKRKQQHHG